MFVVKLISVCVVMAALVGVTFSAPDQAARLIGGQDVDNLRQFPHHVYIIPFGSSHRCGGTILNSQWVLTSASCVKNSIRLDLNFGKKSQNNTRADFFSVSVNSDHVFLYPTNYDDIALIKIPLQLVFSETIAPVSISKLSSHALDHRFSVMPGFNEVIYVPTPPPEPPTPTWWETSTLPPTTTGASSTTGWRTTATDAETTTDAITMTTINWESTEADTGPPMPYGQEIEARHFEGENYEHGHHAPPHPEVDGLKYGMFSIVDHHVCKRNLGEARFDEYTQLCVEGWGTNPNAPCCSDFGSGLIVGWPAKSELVGIFSMFSPTCTSKLPSIFTYVPKYLPWIESMIRG